MSSLSSPGARPRARILVIGGLVLLLGGAALTLPSTARAAAPAAATTSSSATAPSSGLSVAQLTQRVVDDTNAVRAEQGLPALVRDADLDRVAADWAAQQWRNGAMSHNPNYSKQIPAGWQRAGENVGKGYTSTQIVAAWKASSSHYANLVNDYTSVGVGYFEQDGRRYWSQVFAKYPGVTPPAPAAVPAPAPAPAPGTSPAPAASTASPAAEPAAPAGTPVALSSPSFESGLGTWSAPGGSIDGPNARARGGSRSLLVPGASGRTVTQSVSTPVAAGATHTAVVWVRADGAASGTVVLRSIGGAGSAEVATVGFTASADGWTRVPVSLTAKRDHTGFRVEIATTASGRLYRLDSVSLIRTGEPPAAAAPTTPATSPTPSNPAPAPSGTPTTTPPPPVTPEPTPAPAPAPLLDLGILRLGGRG